MSQNNCSICNKEYDMLDKERNVLLGKFWHLCSVECYEKWWRGRITYTLIHIMKEMPTWSFEKFNSVFCFGIEGGYAQGKYELMQKSQFFFLCSLSLDKIILLAEELK